MSSSPQYLLIDKQKNVFFAVSYSAKIQEIFSAGTVADRYNSHIWLPNVLLFLLVGNQSYVLVICNNCVAYTIV